MADIKRLKAILSNSRIQVQNQPLYQVIYELINALSDVIDENSANNSGAVGKAPFLTHESDLGVLPNSQTAYGRDGININKGGGKFFIGQSIPVQDAPPDQEMVIPPGAGFSGSAIPTPVLPQLNQPLVDLIELTDPEIPIVIPGPRGRDGAIIPPLSEFGYEPDEPLILPGIPGCDGKPGKEIIIFGPDVYAESEELNPLPLGPDFIYDTYCPSTATGTVDNWNPGIYGNTYIDWSGASTLTITGLVAGFKGQIVTIRNNANIIQLSRLNAGSSTANQLNNYLVAGGATQDTPIGPRGTVTYKWDGVNWKMIHHDCSALVAYTPTWTALTTNPALGNGSFAGSGYFVLGNLTFFGIKLVTGSTTTFGTGAWFFSLPIVAGGVIALFNAQAIDTGVANYPSFSTLQTTSTIVMNGIVSGINWDANNPFVWGVSDVALVQGWYR